jgi:putative PEP-CTERM system TPR-repeat lipoprotein
MKMRKLKVAFLYTGIMILSACSSEKTAEEAMESANKYIQEKNFNAAKIELKNVLRITPENVEARFLLGKYNLQNGAAASAEKELSRALDHGYDQNLVVPLLAKALIMQNKLKEVTDLVASSNVTDTNAVTSLLLYDALANFKLNKLIQAKDSISEANMASKESIYSQLGNAYLASKTQNIKEAINTVNELLKLHPNFTDALLLQGQLFVQTKNFVSAVKSFENYHQQVPEDLVARLFLADTYIKNGQYKEAEKHLNIILAINDEHAYSNSLLAVIFLQRNDIEKAQYYAEKSINNGLDSIFNRLIAGASAFNNKEYERAYLHLNKIGTQLPENHIGIKLLAGAQLALGHTLDAESTLNDLDSISVEDSMLFTATSFQLLQSGNIDKARWMLDKTKDITSTDPIYNTRIGMLKLSLNDIEGIANLQKAIESNPELKSAKYALAAALMTSKKYDEALKFGQQWQKDYPNEATGFNISADALLKLGQVKEAEVNYNQALKINPVNPISLMYFAAKAESNGDLEKTIKNLKIILDAKPTYRPALISYYVINKRLNQSELGLSALKNAYEHSEHSLEYKIIYAKGLVAEKQPKQVLDLLQNLTLNKATDSFMWFALGDSYAALKQYDDAIEVFKKWTRIQPQEPRSYLRLINVLKMSENFDEALKVTELALKDFSASPEFLLLRVHFLLLKDDLIEAQIQLDNINEKFKNSAQFTTIQTQIWLKQGKYQKALPILQSSYKVDPSTLNALKVSATFNKLNKSKERILFLEKHTINNPKDTIALTLLAEAMVITQQTDKAISYYKKLISLNVVKPLILNNLAWLLYEKGLFIEAEKHALAAKEAAPERADVLDTLGMIQLKLKKYTTAIENLKLAMQISPQSKNIKRHYQEALKLTKN